MKIQSATENWLTACDWLCRSWKLAGHNADIWAPGEATPVSLTVTVMAN
ncbi:MAG: hypothetical protein RSA95_00425 [Citrobacter sp.]